MMRQFEKQLAGAWPGDQWQSVPVIVAVSGGADSVALLRGLVSLARSPETTLIAGHFNHRLRVESEEESAFVHDLSRHLQVRCALGDASTDLLADHAGSVEEAARDARYEFLIQVARRFGARYIVTAHTADDQAETILHRIVRGTGIRGLAGIPSSRELVPGITLRRPLLDFPRSELVAYLDELGQPFRNDPTNLDQQYTRNRIRNTLLPQLRNDYNPHVDASLRRLGVLAEEMSSYVELVASEQLACCVQIAASGVSVDMDHLSNIPPLIVRTVFRLIWRIQGWPEQEMTFERWHELEQLAKRTESPGVDNVTTLPANIRVERAGSRLVLKKQG